MDDKIVITPASAVPVSTWWDEVKAFFKYSETILLARLTAITGLVTTAVGYMDWSPLLGLDLNTGFSKAQVMWTGGIVFIKGIIDEIARRRNALDLK